ncbi:hypothetical protein ACLB6G_16055 [Zhengella sp. ZM62]|uniref:hypothetical protein n=1 Tax=Zhengella sedimenti TaxID=3390035 RepID=UPI003975F93E
MTEVTNALMVELPKRFASRFDLIDTTPNGTEAGISNMRAAVVSVQAGMHNTHGILARQDGCRARIGYQLEPREPAGA